MEFLVSVIIPTYNRANFLSEALESVFSQSCQGFEVIVVDDGSTDETSQIVSKFPQVIYIRQQHKGVASARNLGIKYAKGDLITFLDSDDLWLPKKLEYQIAFFRNHPEAVAVQTEEIWIKNGKRINPKKKHLKEGGWIFHRCVKLCLVSPSGIMLRRKVFEEIGQFDEEFPVCEDYEFWLRLSVRYPIYLISEPLVIKRGGHPDQLSRRSGLDWFRLLALYKLIKTNADLTPGMKELAIKEAIKKGLIYANGALKRKKYKEAFETYKLLQELSFQHLGCLQAFYKLAQGNIDRSEA